MKKKIAIIGAGASGMVCAHELQKKGHDVTVFDKSRGPSGRLTTKRWDEISGIGIDMGAPYIEESQIKNIGSSVIHELINQKIISHWPLTIRRNNQKTTVKTWVGSAKMSQVTRYLSKTINIQTEQKVLGITFQSDWSIHTDKREFNGFDILILAIPAPQVTEIDGVSDDILSQSKKIKYSAVNTMLIEMRSPLWFDNFEEDHIKGPILKTIIANYLKPNRTEQRYTYAVHSQPDWATKRFDDLSKDDVESIMLDSLLKKYNRQRKLVLKTHIHRWKYAYLMGPLDSLQIGYLRSSKCPLYACGDWCQGPGIINAIESGYLLAHNLNQ